MLGTVEVWKRGDGAVGLGEAAPMIAMTLELIAQAGTSWLQITDGMVVLAGIGLDEQPREYRYRAVGFQASAVPLAAVRHLGLTEADGRRDEAMYGALNDEGGYVLLERVA